MNTASNLPLVLALVLTPALGACGGGSDSPSSPPASTSSDLIFASVEADGTVAALSAATGALAKTIDVTESMAGEVTRFDVHNVQGSPDAKMVWATAMPAMDGGGMSMTMPDELIGIDASTFAVTKRISLGMNQHPAHVVLDGASAFVTAFEGNAVLEVDLEAGAVTRTLALPAGTSPHGARLTPDRRTLVVAGMGTGALVLIDLASAAVTSLPLPAPAVQVAVLPDGSAAFATVYATRQVARVELASHDVKLFALPAGAVGPVQLYPTPDGAHLWVADQGVLDGQPAGNHLYRLVAVSGEVDLVANVGSAPHGVVVDEAGAKVWTTLQNDGAVQSVDAATGALLSTTSVGHEPNGITCVHAGGSMP